MKPKKRTLEKIIDEFVEACIRGGEALEQLGDARTYNKQRKVAKKLRNELISNPEYSIESLMPLLSHSNDFVRIYTAYSMLPIVPDKAEAILLEISQKKGTGAAVAYTTLRIWKEGGMTFDYK